MKTTRCIRTHTLPHTLWTLALSATVLIAGSSTASAQTAASFRGTVRDQSGAAVPGAVVVIRNERTGEERNVAAAADGTYAGTNLKPSLYTIKTTVGSFAPLEYTGLELAAAQTFYLDLELRPQGVTEMVTVKAAAPSVDLSSA